jgi:hypothetical protein
MEQQQRVEYTHVTDHMVMHCVRLLATLGKFKVQQQHDTRNASFLRCKLALSPATVILVCSYEVDTAVDLTTCQEYANRRI